MKITINIKKDENIELGDFLVICGSDGEKQVRQIIRFKDWYIGIDIKTGNYGFFKNSIKELYKEYLEVFDEVRLVKNSDVETIIGGGQEENV